MHFAAITQSLVCKWPSDACTSATEIEIASDVSSIADKQFQSHQYVQTITFDESSECTTFGTNSFDLIYSLVSITLPSSLQTIGMHCFRNCNLLKSISFPSSLTTISSYAFTGCRNLRSVTFPESGSISIGHNSFHNIPLATFEIGISVSSVVNRMNEAKTFKAFACHPDHPNYCVVDGVLLTKDKTTLVSYPPGKDGKEYTVPNEIETIGRYAFASSSPDVTFEDDTRITTLDSSCFYEWLGYKIIFPPNCALTSFPASIFGRAANLRSLTVPAYITEIQENAFSSSYIEHVVFERPSLLEMIGGSSFKSQNLKTIDLDPDCPLSSIPSNAFEQCPNLDSFTFPNNVQSVHGRAFRISGPKAFIVPANHLYLSECDGVLYDATMSTLLCYPPGREEEEFVFPAHVENTQQYSFEESPNLKRISFATGSQMSDLARDTFSWVQIDVDFTNAQNLKTIGTSCFSYNKVLTTLTLPDSVTTISDNAFSSNTQLVSVKLSRGLNTIEGDPFNGCGALPYLEFNKYCPLKSITTSAFRYTAVEHLILPSNIQSIHQNAFANTIKTVTFTAKPAVNVVSRLAVKMTNLEIFYVPCEHANWIPEVEFAGQTPEIIFYDCASNLLIYHSHWRIYICLFFLVI